jgi:hypothetical protein
VITRAYVGLAGPFAYDYGNLAPPTWRHGGRGPNPVLENVLGLILCYDEIYFLAPHLCPADMRRLPYVKFVTSDQNMRTTALEALAAFESDDQQQWEPDGGFETFVDIARTMEGDRSIFNFDHHSPEIRLADGRVVTGNPCRVKNTYRDLWVVSELELPRVDVIFSSPAQDAVQRQLEWEVAEGHYIGPTKREAAQNLAALRVPNFLGPRGSYHEALEELRDRPDVREFRQYLIEVESAPAEDGITLANRISRQAFDYGEELSRRYLKGRHWFQSYGIPAVSGVLNQVQPLLGTAIAQGLQAPLELGERRFRSESRWAPFVVYLHGPKDIT